MVYTSVSKEPVGEIDISEILGAENPHALYRKLREDEPLTCGRFYGDHEVWIVTRYDDIRTAFKHPGLSSDWRQGGDFEDVVALPEDVRTYFDGEIVAKDGEEHARPRRLAARAFTARRVAGLRERIETIVSDLLDSLAAQPTWDVVADYASVVPVAVLSELLGVEPEHRVDLAAHIGDLIETRPDVRKEVVPRAARGLVQLIEDLVARRRTDPGEDLISDLVTARDHETLTDEEVVSLAMLVVRAGYETTGNTIATGVFLLLTELDEVQRQAAVAPDRVAATFDEVVRFGGPAELVVRFSRDAVDLGSGTIPVGRPVVLCCGAANRDPRRFDRPETFDPWREDGGHLGFGHGPHFCLGAALARAEGEVALGALLRRWPNLALDIDRSQIEWRPSLMRGLTELPVRRALEAS